MTTTRKFICGGCGVERNFELNEETDEWETKECNCAEKFSKNKTTTE